MDAAKMRITVEHSQAGEIDQFEFDVPATESQVGEIAVRIKTLIRAAAAGVPAGKGEKGAAVPLPAHPTTLLVPPAASVQRSIDRHRDILETLKRGRAVG